MKKEIGKGAGIAIIVVIVIVLGWFGMRAMETPENRGLDEEKIFREAEANAKKNGVDIKTLPVWGELYYKYHPEEKRAAGTVEAASPPAAGLPPVAADRDNAANPGAPPPAMR